MFTSASRVPDDGEYQLPVISARPDQDGSPWLYAGEPRPLQPGAGLAAYRVVQEGLTNVLRHAGQATAMVAIDWGENLVITVTDDGGLEPGDAGARRAAGPPGRGLLGLRERLALYGGTLAAGPQHGCGWRLQAVLALCACVAAP